MQPVPNPSPNSSPNQFPSPNLIRARTPTPNLIDASQYLRPHKVVLHSLGLYQEQKNLSPAWQVWNMEYSLSGHVQSAPACQRNGASVTVRGCAPYCARRAPDIKVVTPAKFDLMFHSL
eukprot:g50057.t1